MKNAQRNKLIKKINKYTVFVLNELHNTPRSIDECYFIAYPHFHFLVRLMYPDRMLDKLTIHDRSNFARIALRLWFSAPNQSASSLIANLRPWLPQLLDMTNRNWIRNLLQMVVHERNSDDPVCQSIKKIPVNHIIKINSSKIYWIISLTDDSPNISSLTFSSFWCPAHGTLPLWMPCWLLMKSSCSLLNSPRMFCKKKENPKQKKNRSIALFKLQTPIYHTAKRMGIEKKKWTELTLSLTVSLIFELALLTAEYKNDPKFFAPCVTFVVTVWQKKREEKKEIQWEKGIRHSEANQLPSVFFSKWEQFMAPASFIYSL